MSQGAGPSITATPRTASATWPTWSSYVECARFDLEGVQYALLPDAFAGAGGERRVDNRPRRPAEIPKTSGLSAGYSPPAVGPYNTACTLSETDPSLAPSSQGLP